MNPGSRYKRFCSMGSLSAFALVALSLSPSVYALQLSLSQQQRQIGAKPAGPSIERRSLLEEAASLFQAGKLDEAETLARRAVAEAPRDAQTHNLLGAVLDERKQTHEAD